MTINRYLIAFSWAWSALAIASGSLVSFISGWTLLHNYPPLFWLTLGIFCGSLLVVPALLSVAFWEWRSGRASRREFLFHFLTPQLFVIAVFLIAYLTESIRTHAAY